MRFLAAALIASLCVVSSTFAQIRTDVGHIQIRCDSGIQIFLDGVLRGVSASDVGGLILQDVVVGRRTIRAVREGFQPQEEQVTVKPGEVVLLTLRPLIPKIVITESGDDQSAEVTLKVGKLEVQSLPIECRISIPRLNVQANKTQDRWKAENIPIGEYTLVGEALRKRLSHYFTIVEAGSVDLMMNFLEGVVTEHKSRRKERDTSPDTASRTQARSGDRAQELVLIAPGTFTMGSSTGEPLRGSDETQHTVTLTRGFYMSRYEVTEQWWSEVMGGSPSTSRMPQSGISWDMAVQFCNLLSQCEGLTPAYTIHGLNGDVTWNREANGYRLPTEAEWEYACRAGTTTAFHNGTNCLSSDTEANYNGNYPLTGCAPGAYRETHDEVGSFPPNAWGLHDMHGNVFEWVWDTYNVNYQHLPAMNPVHDTGRGWSRVIRGGSWYDYARDCRSAFRSSHYPLSTFHYNGFRPVRSAF